MIWFCFLFLSFQVERSTAPKPQEEFTGMMGNLAKALDERHKVMHSSGKHVTLSSQTHTQTWRKFVWFILMSLWSHRTTKEECPRECHFRESKNESDKYPLISGFPAVKGGDMKTFF